MKLLILYLIQLVQTTAPIEVKWPFAPSFRNHYTLIKSIKEKFLNNQHPTSIKTVEILLFNYCKKNKRVPGSIGNRFLELSLDERKKYVGIRRILLNFQIIR